MKYLTQYWRNNNVDHDGTESMEEYANSLVGRVSNILQDKEKTFVGISPTRSATPTTHLNGFLFEQNISQSVPQMLLFQKCFEVRLRNNCFKLYEYIQNDGVFKVGDVRYKKEKAFWPATCIKLTTSPFL